LLHVRDSRFGRIGRERITDGVDKVALAQLSEEEAGVVGRQGNDGETQIRQRQGDRDDYGLAQTSSAVRSRSTSASVIPASRR
jgi:hypothetical protein